MDSPTLTDYVTIICTLFDQFEQEQAEVKGPKRGRPFTYPEKMFIVFFIIMKFEFRQTAKFWALAQMKQVL